MKKLSISTKLKIVSATLAIITVLTVSPTLAYLSATTEPVVNYFSGGAIAITLDEAPVDTDGKATDGDRVQENHYKYTAGAELDKDPTVTVLANSEDCYVYVCIDNELPSDLFSINVDTDAWTFVSTSGTMTIYRYAASVESSEIDQALIPVFTTVTVSGDLTSEDIENLGTKTLTVTAFAIQTASLTTAEADDLAVAYFFDGVDVASIEAEVTSENTASTQAVQTTSTATETVSSEATAATAATDTTVSGEAAATAETTVSTEETSATEAAENTASAEETAETEAAQETASGEETTETEAAQESASEEESTETEAAEETASEEGTTETEASEETASAEETADAAEAGESEEFASEEATE